MNPYASVANSIESQIDQKTKQLEDLSKQAQTSLVTMQMQKIQDAIVLLRDQLAWAQQSYQWFNDSLIASNVSMLWADFQPVFTWSVQPIAKATDQYVTNLTGLNQSVNQTNVDTMNQQLADAQKVAQQQRSWVLQTAANQAGLTAWLGTKAWLSAWQITAWQNLVNAGIAQNLGNIDKELLNQAGTVRWNLVNLNDRLLQVAQQIEAQKLQTASAIWSAYWQIASTELQKKIADAARWASYSSGYNIPEVPKADNTSAPKAITPATQTTPVSNAKKTTMEQMILEQMAEWERIRNQQTNMMSDAEWERYYNVLPESVKETVLKMAKQPK